MRYTKQQWYTPAEVAVHNIASDCWVSLNGKVYNLTSWLERQIRICSCVKTCSCAVKTWYCDNCVEYCPCFKQGYFYCDGKRVGTIYIGFFVVGYDIYGKSHTWSYQEIKCFHPDFVHMVRGYIPFTKLAMTILAYAGKDLSYWFKGAEWVRYTHPIVGSSVTYRTHGHGNRGPVVPSTKWRPYEKPWWHVDDYVVGKATARTRPIRITNTLTGSTVTLEVCSEETIYEIMMRYLPHNSHLLSYSWRYMGKALSYKKTLADNGIPDERERFSSVALAENMHIPAILIYYNDDLTEDPPRDDCFCQVPACVLKRPENCFKS